MCACCMPPRTSGRGSESSKARFKSRAVTHPDDSYGRIPATTGHTARPRRIPHTGRLPSLSVDPERTDMRQRRPHGRFDPGRGFLMPRPASSAWRWLLRFPRYAAPKGSGCPPSWAANVEHGLVQLSRHSSEIHPMKAPDYSQEERPKMRQKMPVLTALALLAGASVMVTATTYAQTSGGDRRDDRRDNRQDSRAQKKACKAGDEKSRSDCRQEKRDTKHGSSPPTSSPTPAASTPTPASSTPTPAASTPAPAASSSTPPK